MLNLLYRNTWGLTTVLRTKIMVRCAPHSTPFSFFRHWDSVHCTIVGWLAVSMVLAGCRPNSAVPPAFDSPSRVIEHAQGKSRVPKSPQRVVVLDTAPLDAVLALGIQPVGAAVYGSWPTYLEKEAGTISSIGDPNYPSMETVLSLKPDLILGSKLGAENLYSQLLQIAPTVFTEGSGRSDDWQENLHLYAKALGKHEQAEQLLEDYQQRVQHLQENIDQPQALEISVLIVNDNVRAYTTGSFSGSILQDVGFSRPPAQDDPEGYSVQLSPEALDALDGDYIFLIYSTYRPGGFLKEDFVTNPIWSQLTAVQQGRVCEVSGEVWIAGRNILAANEVLTDIETCLGLALEQTGSRARSPVRY